MGIIAESRYKILKICKLCHHIPIIFKYSGYYGTGCDCSNYLTSNHKNSNVAIILALNIRNYDNE